MNISKLVITAFLASMCLYPTLASAEDIRVLSSVGIKAVVEELGPQFEQKTKHKVTTVFDLAGVLKTRIEGGEPFDVAILTPAFIDELISKGKIAAASRNEIARTGLGLMIRAGAPKPDVSTTEAFRKTLLGAKSITYVTTGASGVAFLATVEKMGIADAIKAKAKPAANGDQVNANILSGAADFAVLPVSEILPVKGAELGGVFPAAVQTYIVMAAGVSTRREEHCWAGVCGLPHVGAHFRSDSRQGHGAVTRRLAIVLAVVCGSVAVHAGDLRATRFAENPLITLTMSPSIGDNANGPTVIRVPKWVQRPLGRYYMYFAHHSGQFIRLAYADSVRGPWKIHEPGVLKVEDTAFHRPQPDPPDSPSGVYTHLASPEIFIDERQQRIVLWVHGMWTEGQRWPERRQDAAAWVKQRGYAQFTQAAESREGLSFRTHPAITKQSYLRVFPYQGQFYGMARLGQLLRAPDALRAFELGDSPFRETPYAGRVRHVSLLEDNGLLHIVFSAIGDAPESILYTTMR